MDSDDTSGGRVRAKATLTRDQFDAAIGRSKSLKARTIAIARGVLVDGRPLSDFVAAYGLSKSAVSQAVSRIAAYCDVPAGHVQITAVLPRHQADIVSRMGVRCFARSCPGVSIPRGSAPARARGPGIARSHQHRSMKGHCQ